MNSNKDELPSFIVLMHSVGVDRVKLMSLGREHCMELDGPVQQRGAFVFDYEKEMVPIEELEAIGHEARRAADEMNVDIYLDWEDFRAHHGSAAAQPLCSEPWKNSLRSQSRDSSVLFRPQAGGALERAGRSLGRAISRRHVQWSSPSGDARRARQGNVSPLLPVDAELPDR